MRNELTNTRRAVIEALLERAEKDDAVVLVCADSIKSIKADDFAQRYPQRFFDVGIAEQNAVAIAAGLASSGLKPYVATYAGFLTMRACEQIRTFVAYPQLNVKIVGANGGIYGGEREGVTHQFFEDLGIMRSIPEMMVVSPADALEVYEATKALLDFEGPAYLRVGSGREKRIFDQIDHFQLSKPRAIYQTGYDAVIFATGPITKRALQAAEKLKQAKIFITVVNVPTLKPIDKEEIAYFLKNSQLIITLEDHNIIGGLGSAIAEVSTETIPKKIIRMGLQDIFPESGEAEALLDKYGMSIDDIIKTVRNGLSKLA